jgi:hypothetical protein
MSNSMFLTQSARQEPNENDQHEQAIQQQREHGLGDRKNSHYCKETMTSFSSKGIESVESNCG